MLTGVILDFAFMRRMLVIVGILMYLTVACLTFTVLYLFLIPNATGECKCSTYTAKPQKKINVESGDNRVISTVLRPSSEWSKNSLQERQGYRDLHLDPS